MIDFVNAYLIPEKCGGRGCYTDYGYEPRKAAIGEIYKAVFFCDPRYPRNQFVRVTAENIDMINRELNAENEMNDMFEYIKMPRLKGVRRV